MSESKALAVTPPTLSGAERAALVLRELGETTAAAVLREMDDAAVNRISVAMTALKPVPPQTREDVMLNFAQELGFAGIGGDGLKFLSRVLVQALGEGPAREIIERLTRAERKSAFQLPPNTDARTLAMQMAHERPQTLALLLAHIPPEMSANLLTFLPDELAADALYRFSTLDVVSPQAVNELRDMLHELATATDGGSSRRVANLGGAKPTADLLNHFPSAMSEAVLNAIEGRDAETAAKIRENMFTFADLVRLTDRNLQILLRDVAAEKIAPALRLVDDTLRNRFFQNMSARQVEVLKEELRSGPPMRRADALTAQSDIVEVALRLAGEGRIAISATEEMV